jgi:hypothetical protein
MRDAYDKQCPMIFWKRQSNFSAGNAAGKLKLHFQPQMNADSRRFIFICDNPRSFADKKPAG